MGLIESFVNSLLAEYTSNREQEWGKKVRIFQLII